jgi:hypothetical protein
VARLAKSGDGEVEGAVKSDVYREGKGGGRHRSECARGREEEVEEVEEEEEEEEEKSKRPDTTGAHRRTLTRCDILESRGSVTIRAVTSSF